MSNLFLAASTLGDSSLWLITIGGLLIGGAFITLLIVGMRFIPNDRVGVVEKLWSATGSVGDGRIMAIGGEAGYKVSLLRGGVHFGLWAWQYRVHKTSLVTIPQGKIGYIYARDGKPLTAGQTLGKVVECSNFQDARKFLINGERGRQRAILREGVYAINLALFVVITEDAVFFLRVGEKHELQRINGWQQELRKVDGFRPVVIGGGAIVVDPVESHKSQLVDTIGIVTVHDGPSLSPGEIIAPAVGCVPNEPDYHNNFQDPEAFLRAGGQRGRQYVALTDGTYFINRWFASIEIIPKSVVPIGYVGVVVSYYGPMGKDLSGATFRHGERVGRGERGVWERPLGPGKYPFNTYAGVMVLVPTTNFVLHWATGRTEAHRYDDTLKSIEMVTRDAYEPTLPLSVVVHIDYMKAPSVIQRFGDVKKLITQTLDPMLSAYFRDIAHKKTMLELLQQRDEIQREARGELQKRFQEFDIECVDVLIGKPDTDERGGKIETLLEQLRQRQLSKEQIETFEHQRHAAEEQRKLNEAQALAARQADLTASSVQIQIAENAGNADLARARKQAEQAVVMSEAELEKSRRHAEQILVTAKAEAEQKQLAGRGEGQRLLQIGLAEATVLTRKIDSFHDPRLYTLALTAEYFAQSTQPLVPEKVFVTGGASGEGVQGGVVGQFFNMMLAEKAGFPVLDEQNNPELKQLADRMSKEALASIERPAAQTLPTTVAPSTELAKGAAATTALPATDATPATATPIATPTIHVPAEVVAATYDVEVGVPTPSTNGRRLGQPNAVNDLATATTRR